MLCVAGCLIFLVLSSSTEGKIQLEFIEEPASQNVSEGSQATFNCTATSLSQYWLINNQSLTHLSNSNRGLVTKDYDIDDSTGLKTHLLTVPATEINNVIIIQCVIYNTVALQNIFIDSTKIILQIQGILEPVHSLQAVWLNSSSIQVSFTPPYTLDRVPIRNYTIEMISTDTNSFTQYLTTVETIMIIHNMSWCYDHYITVSAWNDAGQGNETTIKLDRGVLAPGPAIINTTVSMNDLSNGELHQVILSTTVYYINSMVEYDVISVTVHPVNNTDEVSIFTANCLIDTPSQCDDVIIELSDSKDDGLISVSVDLTDYVQNGYMYSANISISNCIGTISSSECIFLVADHAINVQDHTSNYSNINTTINDDLLTPSSSSVSQLSSSTCSVNCITESTIASETNTSLDTDSSKTPFAYIVIGLGTFCISLIIAIVVLFAGLIKYKKDSKKYKNDLISSGKDTGNNADRIMKFQGPVIGNSSSLINSYCEPRRRVSMDVSSSSPPEGNNPLYENLDDIQLPRRQDNVEMIDCPAYGSLHAQRKTS